MDPLLERARAGDRSARNELAIATASDLRSFVERSMGEHLRRQLSPEDICQDALLQALDAIPALQPDATIDDFRRVLLKNASWIVMDRGRRGRRFFGESTSPEQPLHVAQSETGATSGGGVTRADDMRWMHALIDRLDPRYGRVIAGRLEGKGFEEIALELGESPAAIRKRFQRAVSTLKRVVADRTGSTRSSFTDRHD